MQLRKELENTGDRKSVREACPGLTRVSFGMPLDHSSGTQGARWLNRSIGTVKLLSRLVASLVLALTLTSFGWAEMTTADYLDWLNGRRQLWVQEMKRMEAHEHGQYRQDYRKLSDQMNDVRQRVVALKQAKGEQEVKLRQELIEKVGEVEQGLEFLLSETPELASP